MTTTGLDRIWNTTDRASIVRMCAAISGAPHAAEDLAQETLLEAWRNEAKLTDPSGADRWLAAIARNVCRRWLRSQGRTAASVVPDTDRLQGVDEATPGSDSESVELRVLLDAALSNLPALTREVLIRRYFHDATHAEIANRVGLSTEAITMRSSRGRAALRRILQQQLAVDDAETTPTKDHGWLRTATWCTSCGRSTLLMRHDRVSTAVSFKCPRCHPDPLELSHQYCLDVPLFARLLSDLSQPAIALRRATAWSWNYFQAGAETGRVSCPRCGHLTWLQPYVRERVNDLSRGVYAECSRCGLVVCTSTSGVALGSPAARRFLRRHPRARVVRTEEVRHKGAAATSFVVAEASGSPALSLVVAAHNLRLLQSRVAVPTSA